MACLGWEIETLFRQKETSLKTPFTLFMGEAKEEFWSAKDTTLSRAGFQPARSRIYALFIVAPGLLLVVMVPVGFVKAKEELLNFPGLMNNVWEGIVDWRNRSGPKPELASGLGAIESNGGQNKRLKI